MSRTSPYTVTTNNIANCIYTEDLINGQYLIKFTTPNSYTSIFSYDFFFGYFKNPSSAITSDSFFVRFEAVSGQTLTPIGE
jgi:hypothetical protein